LERIRQTPRVTRDSTARLAGVFSVERYGQHIDSSSKRLA
jgi:hypothetical protein